MPLFEQNLVCYYLACKLQLGSIMASELQGHERIWPSAASLEALVSGGHCCDYKHGLKGNSDSLPCEARSSNSLTDLLGIFLAGDS